MLTDRPGLTVRSRVQRGDLVPLLVVDGPLMDRCLRCERQIVPAVVTARAVTVTGRGCRPGDRTDAAPIGIVPVESGPRTALVQPGPFRGAGPRQRRPVVDVVVLVGEIVRVAVTGVPVPVAFAVTAVAVAPVVLPLVVLLHQAEPHPGLTQRAAPARDRARAGVRGPVPPAVRTMRGSAR